MILATPIFHPTQIRPPTTVVGYEGLGNQHRVIAERRKKYLVDAMVGVAHLLPVVTLAQRSFEVLPAPRVKGTDSIVSIGEKSDTTAVATLIGAVVVQKFGRTFILSHLGIAVVGYGSDEPVVPHLMSMVGRASPTLMNGGMCLRVMNLIAGIAVGGQAK